MRCLILFIGFLLGINATHAQYVNGKHLDEVNATYIGVETQYPWMNGKLRALIDVGQEVRETRWNRNILSDSEDETIRFNSEIHLFNYLNKLGYVFVQEIYVNVDIKHYLFKKASTYGVEEPEQIDYFTNKLRH